MDVVSTKAMNPPVAITMPGTLSTNFPQPPAMSGVTPIMVIDNPMAMASTAMDRMIHFRLSAGSAALTGDAAGCCALTDLADDVPARGAAGAPAAPGGWCFFLLDVIAGTVLPASAPGLQTLPVSGEPARHTPW